MSQWKCAKYVRCGRSHKSAENSVQNSTVIRENENMLAAVSLVFPGTVPADRIGSSGAAEKAARFLLNTEIPSADNITALTNLKDHLISQIRTAYRSEVTTADTVECSLLFVLISKVEPAAMTGRLGKGTVSIIRSSAPFGICDGGNKSEASLFNDNAAEQLKLSLFNTNDSSLSGFILTSEAMDKEICFGGGSPDISKRAEKYFNALQNKDPEKDLAGTIEQLVSNKSVSSNEDISVVVLNRTDQAIVFEDDPLWLCTCRMKNSLNRGVCRRCGTEFSNIYGTINFERYGGKVRFFRTLNRDAGKEKQLVRTLVKEEVNEKPEPEARPVSVKSEALKSDPGPDIAFQKPAKMKQAESEAIPIQVKKVPEAYSPVSEKTSFTDSIVFKCLLLILGLLLGFLGSRTLYQPKINKLTKQVETLKEEKEESDSQYSNENEKLREENEALQEQIEELNEQIEELKSHKNQIWYLD